MEIAILGLGCFWGPERKFGEIDGVTNTEVGYCGGKNKDTNYQEVCTGTTGHAEVVKIEFDENIITYEIIILIVTLPPSIDTRRNVSQLSHLCVN